MNGIALAQPMRSCVSFACDSIPLREIFCSGETFAKMFGMRRYKFGPLYKLEKRIAGVFAIANSCAKQCVAELLSTGVGTRAARSGLKCVASARLAPRGRLAGISGLDPTRRACRVPLAHSVLSTVRS